MKSKKIDPKSLGIPNICFSLTKAKDDRESKFRRQRMERGFDESETWCLASTISAFILPRLKEFRRLHNLACENKIPLTKAIKALKLILRDQGSWTFDEKEERQVYEGLEELKNNFMNLWW